MRIQDIKDANAAAGYHFFDPGAMRFFSSRIGQIAYVGPKGSFFVTSEQFDADSPRLYSVRRLNRDGSITTMGAFQAYQSRGGANAKARKLAGF